MGFKVNLALGAIATTAITAKAAHSDSQEVRWKTPVYAGTASVIGFTASAAYNGGTLLKGFMAGATGNFHAATGLATGAIAGVLLGTAAGWMTRDA